MEGIDGTTSTTLSRGHRWMGDLCPRSGWTRQPAGGKLGHVATNQRPKPYRTITPRVFVDDPEKTVGFLHDVFDATAEIEPGRGSKWRAQEDLNPRPSDP